MGKKDVCKMSIIYINYGTKLQEITYEIMKEANIKAGLNSDMTIGIKPNLVVSRPAKEGATSHPEIVEGIIQYLQEAGIKNIIILEGSWIGDSTQKAFENCGYSALAKKYKVKLVDTKHDNAIRKESKGIQLNVCESALAVDYLINVPVLKGHCQTGLTCCLKNLKGCIPDSEKRRFHTLGLHTPIAALNAILRPSLHIVDSICGDLSFEEGGNPVVANRIMLGFDPVLLDSYGAQLIGYDPDEIVHLRIAKEYGLGNYISDETNIIELNSQNRPLVNIKANPIGSLLSKYIEEDSACSACYASLIYALDKLDRYKGDRIKIGQGFKGKKIKGLGVGQCTSGCEQYVKGCPPKASDIIKILENL
ncbi:hypothetical protein SD1D_0546 [Herbinix luporum]|jgi:uncharacterized protein (DUF362 family)|uniref:DUF362 domain-containing protein n=2 Tax=Herbinix luporum TaxID=1679721 RepID=A0A0K8J447_9FIRM|nr:hypothetical protein SD1D_0546 [Herbinix luporum]